MMFFSSVKLWLFTLQEYIAGSPLVISSAVRTFVRYPKSPIFLPFFVQYASGGGLPISDLHSQKKTECFLEHFNWGTGWTKGKTMNKFYWFWRHEYREHPEYKCLFSSNESRRLKTFVKSYHFARSIKDLHHSWYLKIVPNCTSLHRSCNFSTIFIYHACSVNP